MENPLKESGVYLNIVKDDKTVVVYVYEEVESDIRSLTYRHIRQKGATSLDGDAEDLSISDLLRKVSQFVIMSDDPILPS